MPEYRLLSFFFFFKAEDGIRDGHVTGVQTCALPIFGGDDRLRGVGARSLAVALDEGGERRAARTAAGAYVAGARLGLLDEDVGVEADAEQVVGGVAGDRKSVGEGKRRESKGRRRCII